MKRLAKRGLAVLRREGIANFIAGIINYINRRTTTIYKNYKFRATGQKHITIDVFDEPIKISTRNYEQYKRVNEYKNSSSSAEKEIVHLLLNRIDNGDDFYDIGSNIGIYSCIIGRNISSSEVFAFEPYPPNVREIKLNTDLNNLDINIYPIALSSDSGTTELQILKTDVPGSQEHTLSEVTYHQETHLEKETIEVDKISGDELIRDESLSVPNVLKIDVEGAGPDVLRGLSETLNEKEIHTLIVEPHNNIPEIEDELLEAGFNIEKRDGYIYAYKNKS
ncbi:FkbM family methyltransferase [Halopenitus persicus]|uniref:FkbM family methyltransferase n=1 Tax=Halopenitus persicus TaxID=1048396 RepID=UPI000B884914|nr:FkbM family methyltransferase [Halopenitus persicus]